MVLGDGSISGEGGRYGSVGESRTSKMENGLVNTSGGGGGTGIADGRSSSSSSVVIDDSDDGDHDVYQRPLLSNNHNDYVNKG